MGCCLIAVLVMAMPRVALLILWLTGYVQLAYRTTLWPLIGFLIMPWTTVAYVIAMAMNQFSGNVTLSGIVIIVIGVFMDLGSHGGAERARRTRRRDEEE
jgi:hypothetical protein